MWVTTKLENALYEEFYKEEQFLALAVKEIKKRKLAGEKYTLQDFIRDHQERPKVRKRIRKKKSIENKIEGQNDE